MSRRQMRMEDLVIGTALVALFAFAQSVGPSLRLNRPPWYFMTGVYGLMIGCWVWEYLPDYKAAYADRTGQLGFRLETRSYLPDMVAAAAHVALITLGFTFAG